MPVTYARRIRPPRLAGVSLAGVSLAIVSTVTPVGFALGTPLGSFLGETFSWRWSFGGLSLVGAVILALIALFVPEAPGQAKDSTARLPIGKVFRIPGIGLILAVIAARMIAHNTIYT